MSVCYGYIEGDKKVLFSLDKKDQLSIEEAKDCDRIILTPQHLLNVGKRRALFATKAKRCGDDVRGKFKKGERYIPYIGCLTDALTTKSDIRNKSDTPGIEGVVAPIASPTSTQ